MVDGRQRLLPSADNHTGHQGSRQSLADGEEHPSRNQQVRGLRVGWLPGSDAEVQACG
jgi:hypothetical protein